MAEHTEGPRVIRCKGSWLEIGRQYGEELRAEIAHAARAIEELAIAAGHDRMSLKGRHSGPPHFLRDCCAWRLVFSRLSVPA